jgi:hypothetical protein
VPGALFDFRHPIWESNRISSERGRDEMLVFKPSRPVGQAVKTPPFHGGNGGSIPPRVTKNFEPLAQLVEHLTFNQGVVGSNPTWLTTISFGLCNRRTSGRFGAQLHTTRSWRNGRRTSLRGWREQSCAGSNPVDRTILKHRKTLV